MRINGTYFERFLFTILPWILLAGIILLLFAFKIWLVTLTVVLCSLLMNLADRLNFMKQNLSTVICIEDKLYINNRIIGANEILIIRPYKNISALYQIFEIYLNDNTCIKFLDQSKSCFYKSNNKWKSKSLDILFVKMPSLKKKMRAENH